MSAPRSHLVGLCLVLGACAGKQAAPLQHYSLGMARAEYRDYTGAREDLCDVEPRWLVDELSSVNGLLSRFLASTKEAVNPQSPQHAEHLGLLKEASRSLGPVMEIHRKNLEALSECDFQRTGAFPDIAQRGTELLELSKARLTEASTPGAAAAQQQPQQQVQAQVQEQVQPQVEQQVQPQVEQVEQQAQQQAQQSPTEEAPTREAVAKQTWCTSKPKPGKVKLYFARQHPNGRIEWLFCDGVKVEKAARGAPRVVTPEWFTRRERRRIQPRRYLEAAKAWPTSEIDRQPGPSSSLGEQPPRAD